MPRCPCLCGFDQCDVYSWKERRPAAEYTEARGGVWDEHRTWQANVTRDTVQAKVSMRRSAAPSQLLKRAQQYRLPFASPAAKRPCPTPQEDVPQKAEPQEQEQPSAVKVRSASDILQLAGAQRGWNRSPAEW
ncbi:hypothetical protein O3P69_013674 [Scylla paramamosain]|uniref:Uncharacterized protein n=1 Tax=Scylla paramamosain TaxID=85552 RepID=A0AAW0SR05_SCYPA